MGLKPAQIIIFSFLAVICIGTFFLSLPISTTKEIPFVDRLFTATSATCVTGLTVISVPYDLTKFGKIVVMLLFQLGGLGIMSFSTIFALILGKRITIKERQILSLTFGESTIDFKKLLMSIFLFTLFIELIASIVLYFNWGKYSFFSSLFHSISAFCNAGFSLFPDSLMRFRSDGLTNFIMGSLIVIGGIGFLVIVDLGKKFKNIILRKEYKITTHAKIVLTMTFILILTGALFLYLLENKNLFNSLTPNGKILASVFQSITSRTAGFSTIDIGKLSQASKLLLISFMFIGASPGSTGGGIKTVTFLLVLMGIFATFRGKRQLILFRRAIPLEILRKAIVIFLLGLIWIIVAAFLLAVFENRNFLNILFEVTSAFGTVGLSCGITSSLTAFSKLVIIFTMFLGRVGPLTLAIALGTRENGNYKLPEEKVMIG
jgi:trk system potassium uptake protein TrkH